MPSALSLAVALSLAAGFTPGFAEGAHVQGARPGPELRRALQAATAAFDACVPVDARGELFIDADVLAAGFIDRAVVIAGSAAVTTPSVIDEACVLRVLRGVALSDRGIEPPTHLLIHLVAGAPLPHPTPRELGEALVIARSDLDRCELAARRRAPALAGSVVLRFHVDDERARAEAIGGSVKDVELHECITRALDGLRVAGAREPAQIVWPIYFARAPRAPPGPAAKPRSAWEAPTLFDFLGCGSLFQ